jgi:hypothetical protein
MAALERDSGRSSEVTRSALGKMCERLEGRSDLTSDDLYNLACYHALRHTIARLDPRGPVASSPRVESSVALDRAVDVLHRAIDAGWTDADWAARDPDLAPLRDRDEFRRLIEEARDRAFPADPFAW